MERDGPVGPAERDASPRASDAERGQAVDRLRNAYVEGRLDRDEFEERMRTALGARTHAQLDRLFVDLPPAAHPSVPAPSRAASPPGLRVEPVPPGGHTGTRLSLALMCGVERRGRWRVPLQSTAVAIMGGVVLDLRGAVLSGPEVVINATAFMGGIEIIVPPGMRVEADGFGFMGGWENRADDSAAAPDAPLVRVRGFACMGSVEIKTRPPRGQLGPSPRRHGLA